MALRLAKQDKFYCPGCGQVRRRTGEFNVVENIVGDRILPHEFSTDVRAREVCPGGSFDPVADRAP
jgi:hypothetical protein